MAGIGVPRDIPQCDLHMASSFAHTGPHSLSELNPSNSLWRILPLGESQKDAQYLSPLTSQAILIKSIRPVADHPLVSHGNFRS